MKKLFSILAIFVVILAAGCSNTKTLKCNKETTDDDGYKTTETMNIKYNDQRVLSINQTSISEVDPEYIDLSIGFLSMYKQVFDGVDGVKFEINKIKDNTVKMAIDIDYVKLDVEKIKENFGEEEMDDDMFTSKNITIESLKADKLNGYNCK